MTTGQFKARLRQNVGELQIELVTGTYRPGKGRKTKMPKKRGGTRKLVIPCVRDRVVQSAAATMLMHGLDPEFEPSSFAYRPGRSVEMAVSRVARLRNAGFNWVVDGDITKFFDNVPHDRLIRELVRFVADRDFIDLVSLWLETLAPGGKGLPQGSPISPVLSNLYLDAIDEKIEDRNVRLVRFADDFLLLCREAGHADRALERMAELLEEYGLSLNPSKTRLVTFKQGFRFLGRLFVRSLVLEDEYGDPLSAPMADLAIAEEADRNARDAAENLSGQATDSARLSPGLRVLYLATPGSRLELIGEQLIVFQGKRKIFIVQPGLIDRIEFFPDAGVEDEALRHMLSLRIAVHFVDGYGAVQGTLAHDDKTRADLHLAQAAIVLDDGKRRNLAEQIVSGRIHNQRALLRRLNRNKADPDVTWVCEQLNRNLRKLPYAPGIANLIGHEGQSTKLYWQAFDKLLTAPWRLKGRVRRPPTDPVNAILSFTSSLLYRDVETAASRAGLHIGFGVLHASGPGGRAVASDLIEAFRGPLAEALTMYLFNNRTLRQEHFTKSGANQPVRLRGEGRDRVIKAYEEWLNRPIKDPERNVKVRWRRMIELQCQRYAAQMMGRLEFVPYRMDY